MELLEKPSKKKRKVVEQFLKKKLFSFIKIEI